MTTPRILEAARADSLHAAAVAYADLGFSVIPCYGKIASTPKWETRQTARASRAVIAYWSAQNMLQNVAIVCGAISGNLVVMDLDGTRAVEAFGDHFPALTDTYTVRSGSGHGAHLYYYAETLPPTTRVVSAEVGNVELRANGCYVVAPPSVHPESHQPYVVVNAVPIMRVANMGEVVTWVKLLIAEKHGGVMPPATNAQVRASSAWALAALRSECIGVKLAPAGARNDTLNRAAFKLGQLVAAGHLSRFEVEQALFNAAAPLAMQDGETSVLRTIASGLGAGMEHPRGEKRA